MNDVPDYVSIFVRTHEILKDLPKGWVEIDRDGVRVLCTRTHPGFSGTILSSTLQRPVEVPIFMSRGNSNDSRVVPWTWFFRDYYGQDPRPIDSNHDWRTGATTIALVGGANQIDPNATLTAVDAGDEARHVFRVRERHPAHARRLTLPHSEAIDVVAAAPKEAHDAVKHRRAVLHQCNQSVFHESRVPSFMSQHFADALALRNYREHVRFALDPETKDLQGRAPGSPLRSQTDFDG